jgi:hypothetical protein
MTNGAQDPIVEENKTGSCPARETPMSFRGIGPTGFNGVAFLS